jgi:adenylosuccinate lyase
MATERWLMLGVKAGGDRQALHEVIRRHSWAVSEAVDRGEANTLLQRLASDPAFAGIAGAALAAELDPVRYVGRAPSQVHEYVAEELDPLLRRLAPYAVTDQAGVQV